MKGRVVEVDICERDVGYVLSVGPVSLWLEPAVAIDVLDTLARAVAIEQRSTPERASTEPAAAVRRRVFS